MVSNMRIAFTTVGSEAQSGKKRTRFEIHGSRIKCGRWAVLRVRHKIALLWGRPSPVPMLQLHLLFEVYTERYFTS